MEIKVKSFIGNLEIIGNGTVHSNEEQPLLLEIDTLEMGFIFVRDEKNKETRTESAVVGSRWNWELTNYVNSLGQGIISPVEIGTLKARRLFVSFYIWTPNEKENRRIINYVIYLEK
jgi:hypothetical protein